jgi:hypothetical protein
MTRCFVYKILICNFVPEKGGPTLNNRMVFDVYINVYNQRWWRERSGFWHDFCYFT